MRKYTKPTVEVVNLKSSKDIATSFKAIRSKLEQQYLFNGAPKDYTVSIYSTEISAPAEVEA